MAQNINPHSYNRQQYNPNPAAVTSVYQHQHVNSRNSQHDHEYNRNAYYYQAINQEKPINTQNYYKTTHDAYDRKAYDRTLYDRSAYKAQREQKLGHQPLQDFNSWIAELNLSSPEILEAKIDEICQDVSDRLNPANEGEYIKIMQSHLLLEVWSQIRTFVADQYVKNEYFPHARIKNLNCTKSSNNPNRRYQRINITQQFQQMNIRNQSQPLWSGSIVVRCVQNNISIPYQCYLLLLWRNKTLPLNFDDVSNETSVDEKSDTNQAAFPPHVIVQVDKLRTQRQQNITEYDITLRLNEKAFRLMKGYKQLYETDDNYDLQVIPIQNLIYLQRDYDAVRNINSMPLCSYIMGRESLMQHKIQNTDNLYAYIKSHVVIQTYAQCLNQSQAVALQEALAKPLTLIHGPPGTGKTKYALLPILKSAYIALKIKYDAINRQTMSRLNYATATNLLNEMRGRWKQARVGVFAGSNQAIDEVILTMLNNYNMYADIPVARMGNTYNMDPDVAKQQAVNINLWMDYYLGFKWNKHNKKELRNYTMKMKQRLNAIDKELNEIETYIHQQISASGGGQAILINNVLWEYVTKCIARAKTLHLERNCLIKVENIKYPNQAQRVLLPQIMSECEVLFCTANYFGRCGSNQILFDFSLFDECCQMRETEILIALQYCSRAVLVGDPKQLQTTVLYHGKYRHLLLNSLFTRVEKYISPILLLEQYRMNAAIASFPSRYFYESKLLNGYNVQNGEKNKSFHYDKSGHFQPYLFFDVSGTEQRRCNSLVNMEEINKIGELLKAFCGNEKYLKEIENIGIITPYSAHKQVIEMKLLQQLRDKYKIEIECATVDEFQGSERDIIIFSCVRSNDMNNVGFLSDKARLNVAITRAKYALWIIGDANCLKSDPIWNVLIQDVRKRNLLNAE